MKRSLSKPKKPKPTTYRNNQRQKKFSFISKIGSDLSSSPEENQNLVYNLNLKNNLSIQIDILIKESRWIAQIFMKMEITCSGHQIQSKKGIFNSQKDRKKGHVCNQMQCLAV